MEFAIQAGRRQDDYREMIVATGFEDVTIGDCRLILGDCREVLPGLQKHDLLLTDPPYGIGADKGKAVKARSFNGSKPIPSMHCPEDCWDDERPDTEVLLACVSAARLAIVWGGNYFADVLPAQGRWLWWDLWCFCLCHYLMQAKLRLQQHEEAQTKSGLLTCGAIPE